MGNNTRRIPFVLNLDDPLDAAIWQVLEPMLVRHRASGFIRTAVAQTLGIGTTPVFAPSSPPLSLSASASELSVAKRPKRATSTENRPSTSIEDDPDSLDAAANNFLDAFG